MFLEKHYQDKIEDLLTSEPFDWHYNDTTVDKSIVFPDSNSYDTVQFTHVFWYEDGPRTNKLFYSVIEPLLDKIDYTELVKVKANLLLPHTNPKQYHIPHWDLDEPGYKTLLYYVNDSDGDTVLFNKFANDEYKDLEIIHSETPKKGNAIVFDSNRYHASNNPIEYNSRIVLNFVYR